MSIFKQKTISKNINFEGVGLHSGKKVSMTLKPSSPNRAPIKCSIVETLAPN